jgi:hypothetical protein
MEWIDKLQQACLDKGYDVVAQSGTLVVFCPEQPDKVFMEAMEHLSELPIRFMVGPSLKSQTAFQYLVQTLGGELKVNNHTLMFECLNEPPDEELWTRVSDLLIKDKYFRSWKITVKGTNVLTYDRKVASECQDQHNFRDRSFSEDEILNLKIALNSCDTVDAFIKSLETQ